MCPIASQWKMGGTYWKELEMNIISSMFLIAVLFVVFGIVIVEIDRKMTVNEDYSIIGLAGIFQVAFGLILYASCMLANMSK
jgi:hypothetical protein